MQPDFTAKSLADSLADAFEMAASLDAPLHERLALYAQQSRKINPAIFEVYDRAVARLEAVEANEIGPRVGDKMPDFLMPDASGRMISLQDVLRDGPAVISLNRGHWCPYCRLDLRGLAEIEPEVKKLGAHVVAITPELAPFTKQAIAANNLPFPILTDVDLSYAALLGLVFWIGEEMTDVYRKANIPIARFQGNDRMFLPLAGKFIIDRSGIIRAREVNVEFRLRMEPARVLAALESLA